MARDFISLRPEAYWSGRDDWAKRERTGEVPGNPYEYGTPAHYAYTAGWLGARVGEAPVIARPEAPDDGPSMDADPILLADHMIHMIGREGPRPLPIHRTEAGHPYCSTCDGGGCYDCTDPA